jgi:hypothetical protein
LLDFALGVIFSLLNIIKNMEALAHFPWKTSMMVFVIDNEGRILLKLNDNLWGTYQLDSTGEVDIRKMVCNELYSHGILTYPESLQHRGILENEGRTFFIYTTNEFETNNSPPSTGSFWCSKEEVNSYKLHDFDKCVLTMILNGEKIGFGT